MTLLTTIAFFISTLNGILPADSISLQYCYQKANENYPLARNVALQEQITALNIRIAHTGYFPDISIGGQLNYQSEIPRFNLPGGNAAGISKDQYEASVDVNQPIFNGGAVGIRKELEQAKGRTELHSTEAEMHQIRSQIDQVYFGILLSQQQSQAIGLLIDELKEQLSAIRSQVKNGVLLPSQQHILEAELIKARQDSQDSQSNITAGYQVLSELIGEEVPTSNQLKLPNTTVNYRSLQPQRPEYKQFESRKKVLEQQKELANTQKWPTLSAFGTAAYGRPGLNFMNNNFHDYYTVGLKIKWNFWASQNAGLKQQALTLQEKKIEQNRRSFTHQLNASLDRASARISAIKENIERNKKAVALREQIVQESASQLENGIITATEYVTELTRANQARLSMYMNRIRLAQAKTDYLTTLGRPVDKSK